MKHFLHIVDYGYEGKHLWILKAKDMVDALEQAAKSPHHGHKEIIIPVDRITSLRLTQEQFAHDF